MTKVILNILIVFMFAGVSFAEDDLSNLSPDLYNQNSTSKHSYGNSQKDYLGELSSNPYDADSVSNPYGKYGSPYSPDSINNPYGRYGSPYSPNSVTNPYATETPKLYDSQGKYKGKLSSNPYDADSVSNPYGKYGSPYSSDSINNPYGAGNPYSPDSPNNPYGSGLNIFSDE